MISVKRVSRLVSVKCLLCSKELRYNNNTSSMLRHYRALHENKETNQGGPGSGEKKDVDESLVNMVIEDSQPFTIVEDKGFRKLVKALNPTYVLPTRQALKAMVEDKYKESKEKAKALVLKASVALDQNAVLSVIRANSRKIVGYFRSSTTAKERLTQVQEQMGQPALKLVQEVDTRWNSTYHMLQRVYDLREPVGAALAGLRTDVAPLSSEQYNIIAECLKVLSPFHDATVELSEEKRVSGSKVIPLLSMLHHTLEEDMGILQTPESKAMAESLKRQLREKLFTLQSMSIMSLATLLDPRFKKIGFFSPNKAAEAEKRLTAECAAVIRNSPSSSSSSSQPHTSEASQPLTQSNKLWHRLDTTVLQTRAQNVTADATVEVQKYLGEPNIARVENPWNIGKDRKSISQLVPTCYCFSLYPCFICAL
ncbi:zinc finger BED domain-containing protein 4-like [Xyrauchen texanus]|uniref:zinc finger BED domain-containing protein 4-like n=1 Tax=Xyrauchen texanus TaxID=154827 RepID=UPI002241FBFA|nr:zinc finger BED domain-containing protein 4-like [Xyrauchen texanus]